MSEARERASWELHKGTEQYPPVLCDDPQCPQVLYGRGQTSALTPGVGIIGSRVATPYGIRCAQLVAEWAVGLGLTVYSGAARGCDHAAQQRALDSGGRSVAVLGCGVDVVYPRSSAKLLEQCVLEGAVVSEFPVGTPPGRWTFPKRNRLIAAFSGAVVVVEGRIPSGTFSTVTHAHEIGRTVCAVPGSIFSAESDAPNRLIVDGAHPITCAADLAAVCGMEPLFPAEPTRVDSRCPVMRALLRQPMSPGELSEGLQCDSRLVTVTLGEYLSKGLVSVDRSGRYHVTSA